MTLLADQELPAKKICSVCRVPKHRSEFHARKDRSADGLRTNCIQCQRDAQRVYYRAHKRETQEARFLKTFGVPYSEYERLYELQEGMCLICNKHGFRPNGNNKDRSTWLVTDHNHETGVIRGLLCNHCNTMLGMASDSVNVLEAAIRYLVVSGSRDGQ